MELEKLVIPRREENISLQDMILPLAAHARMALVIMTEGVDKALAAYMFPRLYKLPMTLSMPPGLVSILGYLTILTGGTGFITELDMKMERTTTGVLGSTRDIAVT